MNRSSSLFLAAIHFTCHVSSHGLNQVVPAPSVGTCASSSLWLYSSHRSIVTHLSLSLIITLHGQVLDQILTVAVVVLAGSTLALMRVGVAGLNLVVYSIRFLVGLATTTLAVTMTALGLDSAEVSVDLLIQHHREEIGAAMVIMIVTCLGLGRRTLISIRKCIQKDSLKDIQVVSL